MTTLWRYSMAKKYNELLVSELQAKYNVLAEIDMKKHVMI